MRVKNVLAFGVSLLAAAAVLAQGSGEAKAKSGSNAGSRGAVFKPAANLKWVEVDRASLETGSRISGETENVGMSDILAPWAKRVRWESGERSSCRRR